MHNLHYRGGNTFTGLSGPSPSLGPTLKVHSGLVPDQSPLHPQIRRGMHEPRPRSCVFMPLQRASLPRSSMVNVASQVVLLKQVAPLVSRGSLGGPTNSSGSSFSQQSSSGERTADPGRPHPHDNSSLIPIHPVHPAAARVWGACPRVSGAHEGRRGNPCPPGTRSLKGPRLPWWVEQVARWLVEPLRVGQEVRGGRSTLLSLSPRPGPDPRAGAEL